MGPGGQSCSLCVLRPVHPRPCAVRATAVSAAWATKVTAVLAQVSGWLGRCRREVPISPRHLVLLLSLCLPVADLCQDGHGGCSEHANCSQEGTVVTCVCLPDYEGDGWSCRARNPCADGHRGGCSEHADCLSTGPVSGGGARSWRAGTPLVHSHRLWTPTLVPDPRTHVAVSAMQATWVTDCSVWRKPSRLWTAVWAIRHPATRMPCALTYIFRVCSPAPLLAPCFIPEPQPADHASSLLQKSGLVSSTSRPPVALMA